MNLFLFLLNSLIIVICSRKYFLLKEENTKKYLELSFYRNITLSKSISPEELFKSLFYNQIYITIKIGSEQTEIPFYLYLQQYSLIIQSSEVSKDQVKGLYNELKSKSFISSNKTETFMVMDMSEGILSQDFFYFNNNKHLLDFYLCKKNNDDTHISEGGKIGFKLEPENAQSEEAFFISNLKYKDLISELVFSFKYNSEKKDEDKGSLFIGTYPHLIDNNKYKEEYFTINNAEQIYTKIEWALKFKEIKLGNHITEKNSYAFLYIEIGYIIGTKKYFDYLLSLDTWKKYFNDNNKCHETTFIINDIEKNDVSSKIPDEYTIFYCNEEVDITKIVIGEISFINNELVYSFNFSSNELWEEKNGFKYFKIIKHDYYNDYWYFGKPFFQKFQMVFDYDNKKIGLYSKILKGDKNDGDNNRKHNILVYIIIIIGLLIIIAGLVYIIFKNYKKFTKRKRANELLDDNYDYETNDKNVVN